MDAYIFLDHLYYLVIRENLSSESGGELAAESIVTNFHSGTPYLSTELNFRPYLLPSGNNSSIRMSKEKAFLFLSDVKYRVLNNKSVQKILKNTIQVQDNIRVYSEFIHSFSQYGEDLAIDGILGCKKDGFFIDIGANDPTILSNTKRFYDRGWSGINIEPDPRIFAKIIKERPRNINLNIGIGPSNQISPFYLLSADTLSSFDIHDARRNCRVHHEKIIEQVNIQMLPLVDIFRRYVKDINVDFMSIDVEGLELVILKSNDWEKYRPKIILIEFCYDMTEIVSFLSENDYRLVFKNQINGIFLDTGSKTDEIQIS